MKPQWPTLWRWWTFVFQRTWAGGLCTTWPPIRFVIRAQLLLTPWRKVFEKLTGFQLVKKFPAFYGTRRFITSVTSARHLSLSPASSIQSTPPHPTSWRSIVPNLMPLFRCIDCTKVSAQVRGLLFSYFTPWYVFTVRSCSTTPNLQAGGRALLYTAKWYKQVTTLNK